MWIILGILSAASALQIIQPPQNISVRSGSDIKLACGTSGDESADFLTWMEYITSATGTRIFNSFTKLIDHPNPGKYQVVDKYDLVVKKPTINDGGRYGCSLFSDPKVRSAEVMVFDGMTCDSAEVDEGDEGLLLCQVEYGGNVLPTLTYYNNSSPMIGATMYQKNMVTHLTNFSTSWLDDQAVFHCEASLKSPHYMDSCNTTVKVRYSVRNITFEPMQQNYRIGDVINCTSSANPVASYQWSRILPKGTATSQGMGLLLTPSMVGRNTWKCTASNTFKGQKYTTSSEYSFTVLPGDPRQGSWTSGAENSICHSTQLIIFIAFITSSVHL